MKLRIRSDSLRPRSIKTRVTLFTLAIFLACIWSLAIYAGRVLREDMQGLLSNEQLATAALLAAQVNDALDIRLRALEAVAADFPPDLLGKPAAVQALLEQRPAIDHLFNGGVMVHRRDGTAIAEVPLSAGRVGVNYLDRDFLAAAIHQGRYVIGRPVMGKKLRAPVFSITVPLRDAQGKVIGALAGVINLGLPNFLDRIAAGSYTKTSNYVLVSARHRLIITASDKSRIMEALPAAGVNAHIDRNIQGFEGSAVIVNAHGVELLASIKRIPVADWYVGVTLPTAAAFAPIHAMQWRLLLATMFLTLLASGLIWRVLRRELAPMLDAAKALATLSDTDRPAQPLPVTRQDEIGELIGGFNRLLRTLAQREAAAIQSEERYRLLAEASHDLIVLINGSYQVEYANTFAARRLRRSPQELIGKRLSDIFPPEIAARQETNLQKVFDSAEPLYVEAPSTFPGGSLWLGSWLVPIKDPSGGVTSTLVMSRDITERKRADVAVQESKRILAAIIDNLPFLAWLKDSEGRFLAVNEPFAVACGLPCADDLIGKTDLDIWPKHLADVYRADDFEVMRSRHKKVVEEPVADRGEEKWFETYKSPLYDLNGDVTGTTGFARDITERKRAEQRLQASVAEKDVLMREIHHRVKNNLQMMSALLELQSRDVKDAQALAYFKDSQLRIQSMAMIHAQLYQNRNLAQIDFAAYVQTLVDALRGQYGERCKQVAIRVDAQACILPVDAAVPLGLALNELVSNAMKYAFPGGRAGELRIGLQASDAGKVIVEVSDDGVGLPPGFNWRDARSFGLQLLTLMVEKQLGGKLRIESGLGTRVVCEIGVQA